ncbi:hypothetical protein LRAMOSA01764 [Lichtheimia ramosa]|uniref:Uncharacterized protein n=1 Tax=Lichtheimia ramosa TaxID=688394 RepID=A0A077WK81_9FUNG|nr:hypothetical protein LRAMOSA01764 [Lichtheimia ramosa]
MSPAHEQQPISSAPMPLSPIMTEAAFDNYLPPNQLPPPPPPPPPTQQPRTLLRDRGARHPPRIPRLRRLSPPDTDNMRFRCLSDDRVVDMDRLCGEKTNIPGQNQCVLEFDVMEQDGGQYSASYGVGNMLRNDNSVFWLVLLSDTLVQTLMAVFEFDAALQEARKAENRPKLCDIKNGYQGTPVWVRVI